MYAALLAWTGSRVTSACHTFVGGRSGQPRNEVPAGGGGWLGLADADALADGPDAGPVDAPAEATPPGASTNRVAAGRPGEQAATANATTANATRAAAVARTGRRRQRMRIAVA
jgi:hypothetical protein